MVKQFLKISIACILVVFLITTSQLQFQLIFTVIQRPQYFFAIIGLSLTTLTFATIRWYYLNLSQGLHHHFLPTFKATFVGAALNNLLPGAVGGDVYRIFYLFKKMPDKKSTALITLFLDRLIGLLGIVLTVCIFCIIKLNDNLAPHISNALSMLLAIISLGLVLGLALLLLIKKSPLVDYLDSKKHIHFFASLAQFFNSIKVYQFKIGTLFVALVLSVFIQLIMGYVGLLIIEAMDLPLVAFNDVAIALSITQIVNLLPLTPGGIGLGEVAFSNCIQLLNPSISAPYASVFLTFRLLAMVTYLPALLTFLPSLRLSQKNA